MRLTVLGSGTSVPHPKRSSSAYWLKTGNENILLDCSASAIHRMAQEGCDWVNVDAIWISHFHLDHCGGLAPLLFGMKHAPDTQDRKLPLRIFGPPGLQKLIQAFDSANDYGLFKQPFPIELIEVEAGESFQIFDELSGSVFSTPHTDESFAIKLEDSGGRSMVYTADTGYSTNLGVFARGADLLLAECSFIKNKPVKFHLELADIAHLARFATPKRIVLTHLYPEWDGRENDAVELLGELQAEIAFDGMRVDF
jgi:ribonuclease BN (tRNA processing enzyme)